MKEIILGMRKLKFDFQKNENINEFFMTTILFSKHPAKDIKSKEMIKIVHPKRLVARPPDSFYWKIFLSLVQQVIKRGNSNSAN